MTHNLAIDQGNTSSWAIVFAWGPDGGLRPVTSAREEFAQHCPRPGWVEHDPADLWLTVTRKARAGIGRAGIGKAAVSKAVIGKAGIGGTSVAAIRITNQRETTLIWDRANGQTVHPAIVWQDRRTADTCANQKPADHEPMITSRTGLLLAPYFSATKVKWILDHVPGARARAVRGALAFGTVDRWLIWNLINGKVHATDATNAARTMLYNIAIGAWDAETCGVLDIAMAILPIVHDCAAVFGHAGTDLFGHEIGMLGVASDQQAATVGQGCLVLGMMKSTYGTGCCALMNTGSDMVQSKNRLLTTSADQLDGKATHALDGSIYMVGAVVQWLRDGLKGIAAARQTQPMAEAADPAQGVIMVPAFAGLGAPDWQPECRAAIFGLSRNSGPAELARAALEPAGYQTRDLLAAISADRGGSADGVLRVDGGKAANDWAMQFLADVLVDNLGAPVDRPVVSETTALGAAYLAGVRAGSCPAPHVFAASWAFDHRFVPQMAPAERDAKHDRWGRAVAATMLI